MTNKCLLSKACLALLAWNPFTIVCLCLFFQTISPDSKSLNNESENKGTTVAVEKKTDFLEHESVNSSGDNMDKTNMSKVTTTLATETKVGLSK